MRSLLLLALTGLSTFAAATPVGPTRVAPLETRQNDTMPPCAQVSVALYDDPNSDGSTVPAKIALACIKSVTVNTTSAKQLLHELPMLLQFQSTITALASPPEEYRKKVQPPVDILGGLKLIEADLDAGKYETEYDFGWSLYTLLLASHDGHLAFIPDSVGSVFNWGRRVPLVSVSEDGLKLPSVFAYEDVLGIQFQNISYTPSPVVKIDGQDAFLWLERLSQYGSLQDRDALYNNLFYNLAQTSMLYAGSATGMFTGGGKGRLVYPGATTTLTFANGSSNTMQNYAQVLINFEEIKTGEDLAKRAFYYGGSAEVSSKAAPLQSKADVRKVPGFPEPVESAPMGLISGFYIDEPGYEDVAVLQIPNFVGDASYEIAFQQVSKDFIAKAVAAGKTKLIIDVQANGGGTILQGYDLFKQLFPQADPYGGNRFRATEVFDLIGQAYSTFSDQFPRVYALNYTIRSVQSSYFDYRTDKTIDGKPFNSWSEKFGPYEANGDKYTSPHRWNLSDVYISWNSGGINITGYGPLANLSNSPQPFEPENIVLLTDGYCASTCTIFSELLTKQGGVKTIAMGGRHNSQKIQAIGGVKGSNNYPFAFIQSMASTAIQISQGEAKENLKKSVLTDLLKIQSVYSRSSTQPAVNVRDALGYNDNSGIALQFKYEEADCRLYYTPEMTVDATATWKAAVDAQWGNSGKCIGNRSGYGERKRSVKKTESLKKRRLQNTMTYAAAMQKVNDFKKTFDLETRCEWDKEGFMKP